jgi:hypothetical protein
LLITPPVPRFAPMTQSLRAHRTKSAFAVATPSTAAAFFIDDRRPGWSEPKACLSIPSYSNRHARGG